MRSSLHLFLALIIFFTTQAQASGTSHSALPSLDYREDFVVEEINKLEMQQKWDLLEQNFKIQSPEVKEHFAAALNDIRSERLPKLKYKNFTVHFEIEGKKFIFDPETRLLSFEDQTFSLEGDQLIQSHKDLKILLASPSYSFQRFFIDEAHALVNVAIALLAIAVAAFVLVPLFKKAKVAFAKFQCHKVRNELKDLQGGLSQSDAREMKSKIDQILNKTNRGISEKKCETNTPSDRAVCDELLKTKKCYDLAKTEVEEKYSLGINQSERSWFQKLFSPGGAPAAQGASGRPQ